MAVPQWEDAPLISATKTVAELWKRVGLYKGAVRVGTVYTDTTWDNGAIVTESGNKYGKCIGAMVPIVVPAGTLTNGDVITHYGLLNGTTLSRRKDLPYSVVVNDATKAITINVTPEFLMGGQDG